jgi:dihydrofolate synthase/folylpolyglutamate synthase
MSSSTSFDRLYALEQFGIKLGLDNIRALVTALDHPERAYATVLIAGTNGKGSVTAMVERALRAAGHRTGRYTSPHLVHLEERFAIDGRPIDTDTLATVVGEVLDVEGRARQEGRLAAPATFFEVATAAAFELFRRERVEVGIFEVGLGGRFDATNVVVPRVTAIVSIDLDHMKQLGSSIADIAFEKAGTMRPGVPCVIGELPAAALRVIERAADEVGATLVHAAEGVVCAAAEIADGATSVDIETPTRHYGPVTLGLAGAHQIGNALVAVRVLEALDAQGWLVDAPSVESGLRDVDWPGRLQLVTLDDRRQVLLDAAHNPAGARALASHLTRLFPDPVPLVFGVAADKDASGMLDVLAPAVREIVATEFRGARARPAADVGAIAEERLPGRVRVVPVAGAALAAALESSDRVCVAGSIFLLGEVIEKLEAGLK